MKKYFYIVLHGGFPLKYLRRRKGADRKPIHPYEKEPWTTCNSKHTAYQGTRKRPPRTKFGGHEVVPIEIEKIEEFIDIYRTING